MAKLVHTFSGAVVQELALRPGTIRIGRSPDNDIRLDDLTVSGHHAEIRVTPSAYLEGLNEVHVEDLESTNGTLVSGKYVKRHLLAHNEVIEIGMHEFTLVEEDTRAFERTMVFIPEEEK